MTDEDPGGNEEREGELPRDEVVTLPEAARLLGVGPTTLKRWSDQGRVPHTRTPGGHRRFLRSVIRDFRSIVDPRAGLDRGRLGPSLRLGAPHEWLDRANALADPDRMEAALLGLRVASANWGEGGDRLQADLLEGLRTRVADGRLSGGGARALRRSLVRALQRVAGRMRPRTGAPVALLASPAGEDGEILLVLAETALRERGFTTLDVGTATEPEMLETVVEEQQPHVMLLMADRSVDTASLAVRVGGVPRVAAESGTSLWLDGGAAWPRIDGARVLPDLAHLSRAAADFARDLARSRRTPPADAAES